MKTPLRTALLILLLATTAFSQAPPFPRRGFPQQPPNRPGFGRPGLPPPIVDPLTVPPRKSDAPPIDLSGNWKGIYISDDEIILADLKLTTDNVKRTVTGDLRYSTLPPPTARGREATPKTGTSPATGIVDPGSRTALITLPGGIRPVASQFVQPGSAQDHRMHMVFSAARNELAGQFQKQYGEDPKAPYFIFARSAATIQALGQHAASVAPALHVSLFSSAPSEDELIRWSARYIQEYPQGFQGGGGVAGNAANALPLLNDANFKPVFGEVYDVIDFGKLAKAMARTGAPVGGGGGYNVPFVQKYGYLQYIIWPSAPKLVSVAAMRTIDAWESETLAHFQNDPPVASAFEDLAEAQKEIQSRVVHAWPSDRKRTDESIEKLRATMAPRVLAVNVDKAVAGAAGLEGAKALAGWSKDNEAMLKFCSQGDRGAGQQKIDAKLDALLEQLLADPVGQLDRLGSGAEAVKAGAVWHRSLLTQFAFAAQRPPVLQAVGRLSARRGQDMDSGKDPMASQIQACKATADIDSIFTRDLSVPGDESKAAYEALASIAQARKNQIQEAILMSLFSPDEKQYMDRPGHIDLKKGAGRAPSAESIRLAILRGYAYGTGTMLDAHTARCVTRAVLILPFPMVVQITNENLTGFQPVEGTNDFKCEFTMLMQMNIPRDNLLASYNDEVRKGADAQTGFLNGFLKAASGSPTIQTFRLYEDGWGVPSMRAVGAAEAAISAYLKSQ